MTAITNLLDRSLSNLEVFGYRYNLALAKRLLKHSHNRQEALIRLNALHFAGLFVVLNLINLCPQRLLTLPLIFALAVIAVPLLDGYLLTVKYYSNKTHDNERH